jgi:3-hydroxyethyl bacteriochlorophyllide a dehydrogenase
LQTVAVLLSSPEQIGLSRLELLPPGDEDVVVDVAFSGISTGTEKLLFTGRMPPFPGLGYPLVPGYESVGCVAAAGPRAGRTVGEFVFVPGAKCFAPREGRPVHGLFGGSASRLVVPGRRAHPVPEFLADKAVLLALAATAWHAIADGPPPGLVVGHGVLGRLIARLLCATGQPAPVVWEKNPARRDADVPYAVVDPDADPKRDYRVICDVSGDEKILDTLIARLAPQGELVLAGFYAAPLSFAFPPAFMREARLRIAAEWKEADLASVTALVASGALSLDGLITHHAAPDDADRAYRTAFEDPACLKMVLDWRGHA